MIQLEPKAVDDSEVKPKESDATFKEDIGKRKCPTDFVVESSRHIWIALETFQTESITRIIKFN